MRIKRSTASSVGLVLLLFSAGISVLLVSEAPQASAIGCSPGMGDFEMEGPYPDLMKGFADFDTKRLGNEWVENVYVVEPGASASITFGYSMRWGELSMLPRLTLNGMCKV